MKLNNKTMITAAIVGLMCSPIDTSTLSADSLGMPPVALRRFPEGTSSKHQNKKLTKGRRKIHNNRARTMA